MTIFYHGTTEENAQSILKEGFRIGTWFAAHLEDALAFGGPYVFRVRIDYETSTWQFHTLIPIEKESIQSLVFYNPKEIYTNEAIPTDKPE